MNGRNRHELKWQLFRAFFRSRAAFLALFERYEARILSFAESFGTDRTRLKLSADDLLSVLDLKSLEELRDRQILRLKETAHELFRGEDSTDRFDHYVSNIYHEISILKEEHYTLKEDFVRSDQREYDRLFREVSEFYPKRLRHVRNLYGKALRRLEALLPGMAREKVVLRSIYLYGDELLKDSYRGGLVGLYRRMYPEGGEVEAYSLVGNSFLEAGFEEQALAAFRKAAEAARHRRRRKKSERIDQLVEEARRKVQEIQASLPG